MLPVFIIAQISAAASQYAQSNPNFEVSKESSVKTEAELRQERRENRIAETLLWIWILVPGILAASYVTGMLYAMIKIVFSVQGQYFP